VTPPLAWRRGVGVDEGWWGLMGMPKVFHGSLLHSPRLPSKASMGFLFLRLASWSDHPGKRPKQMEASLACRVLTSRPPGLPSTLVLSALVRRRTRRRRCRSGHGSTSTSASTPTITATGMRTTVRPLPSSGLVPRWPVSSPCQAHSQRSRNADADACSPLLHASLRKQLSRESNVPQSASSNAS
jgi:hypothetical protein